MSRWPHPRSPYADPRASDYICSYWRTGCSEMRPPRGATHKFPTRLTMQSRIPLLVTTGAPPPWATCLPPCDRQRATPVCHGPPPWHTGVAAFRASSDEAPLGSPTLGRRLAQLLSPATTIVKKRSLHMVESSSP